jgi:hypothetical protein
MKELDFFRRQFLLTVHDTFDLPWERGKISDYNLFYHPELEFEHVEKGGIELYLLGFLFDYENPEYSNLQILSSLSSEKSFSSLLEQLFKYSGHYVLIYKSDDKLILLNDAVAQNEIYYDKSFSTFGSQPKLLNKVITLLPHTSPESSKFYSSAEFLNRREFVGETTHLENIKHLPANHFIDIQLKTINRFFPLNPIKPISIKNASNLARKMLNGYIKAASMRYNLAMGVTGGYDSRVLFLASLDVECKYYVSKLSHLSDKHHDIFIAKKLTKALHKELTVITDRKDIDETASHVLNISIDFPRKIQKLGKYFDNHIILNGNLSEIARNCLGYNRDVKPKDLAFLYGYGNNDFVCEEYNKWLESNSSFFSEMGYHVLDMSYWEERMGIWAAKAKTEMSALGTIVYSPFCSHKLLITLLSTPRKYRDRHHNKLYNLMIKDFSPEAAKIPVNPTFRNSIIKLAKVLKVYNILWASVGNPVIGSNKN